MIKKDIPKEIIDTIKSHDSFFIVPHIEPDGDCVGSSLALAHFLKRTGKKVSLHNMGPFDRRDIVQYAPFYKNRITTSDLIGMNNPLAIIVDCSTLDRIGDLALDIKRMPVLVIDHHSSGEQFGDFRFVNSTAPSTTMLIQQLIETMGQTPDQDEAELLFFGFCTDTGFFRHLDQNSSEVFPMIGRLIAQKISPKDMYARINSGASLAGRKHLGRLLNRAESYADGKVLVTWETYEETRSTGKQNRESDLLYQMLMGIEHVEVVANLREESPNSCTGGLRSRSWVDVGEIAQKLGGGGHKRASGFLLPQGLKATKEQVVAEILKHFSDS